MQLTYFQQIIEVVGAVIDGLGVLVVVVGILRALIRFLVIKNPGGDKFTLFRQNVGKSILLSLEFLVAGDIIRTIIIAPTLQNVIILAIIVFIRTFLSMALELELEGRWPWQPKAKQDSGKSV